VTESSFLQLRKMIFMIITWFNKTISRYWIDRSSWIHIKLDPILIINIIAFRRLCRY